MLSVASPIKLSVINNAKKRSARRTSFGKRGLKMKTPAELSFASLDLKGRTRSSSKSTSPPNLLFNPSASDVSKSRRASQVAAAASKKRRAGAKKLTNYSSLLVQYDSMSLSQDNFPSPETTDDFPSLEKTASSINIIQRDSNGEVNALAFANRVRRTSLAVMAMKANFAASNPPDLEILSPKQDMQPDDTSDDIHASPPSHRRSNLVLTATSPSHRRNTQILTDAFPAPSSPRQIDRNLSTSMGRSPKGKPRTSVEKNVHRLKRRIASARHSTVRGSI